MANELVIDYPEEKKVLLSEQIDLVKMLSKDGRLFI